MAVAAYDHGLWAQSFPELSVWVTPGMAAYYFDAACGLLDNTDASIVPDPAKRLRLLNLLVAHLAKLFAPVGGQAASPLVGRIASASEGSVSVGTDMPAMPAAAAFFAQTQYGLLFWQMTAGLRTARFVPGPGPGGWSNPNPWRR